MNSTIESEKNAVPAEASKPKAKRAAAKNAKPTKKAAKAKKVAGKTAAARNKRAEVITMLKRAKGVTAAIVPMAKHAGRSRRMRLGMRRTRTIRRRGCSTPIRGIMRATGGGSFPSIGLRLATRLVTRELGTATRLWAATQ